MSSRGKRRRGTRRLEESYSSRTQRRGRTPPARRDDPERRRYIVAGGVMVATLAAVVFVAFVLPGLQGGPGTPEPSPTPDAGQPPAVGPPASTPLADPPAEPAGDGTQVTIETELGSIVIDVFTDSSPVAAQNFINLAGAGFYDGVVFHRLVPGFVIQGGDPEGTGRGGPGYTIEDEEVIGEYVRGTVAMARTPAPNSQGSQFFIVLDDSVRETLPKSGMYAIFGRVVEGMEVVDQIALRPNSGPPSNAALEPVEMTRVTVRRP